MEDSSDEENDRAPPSSSEEEEGPARDPPDLCDSSEETFSSVSPPGLPRLTNRDNRHQTRQSDPEERDLDTIHNATLARLRPAIRNRLDSPIVVPQRSIEQTKSAPPENPPTPPPSPSSPNPAGDRLIPKDGKLNYDRNTGFLTYPQMDVTHQELQQALINQTFSKFPKVLLCTAKENHAPKEGDDHIGKHFHVFFDCQARFRTRRADAFDVFIHGRRYHPHIQAPRNREAVLRYTIKDGDYKCYGIYKGVSWHVDDHLKAVKNKTSITTEVIITEIKKGANIYDLDDKYPTVVYKDLGKIRAYMQFQQQKSIDRKVWPEFPGFAEISDPHVEEAWHTYREMLNTAGKPRGFRQDHIYIHSENPGIGKTYPVLKLLRQFFPVGIWNHRSKFQNIELEKVLILLIDDITGDDEGFSSSEFKALLQGGGSARINQKGGRDFCLQDNCMIVMTSNLSLEDLLHKPRMRMHLASIKDRLCVLHVESPCHLTLNPMPSTEKTIDTPKNKRKKQKSAVPRQIEPHLLKNQIKDLIAPSEDTLHGLMAAVDMQENMPTQLNHEVAREDQRDPPLFDEDDREFLMPNPLGGSSVLDKKSVAEEITYYADEEGVLVRPGSSPPPPSGPGEDSSSSEEVIIRKKQKKNKK